jgi:hypothetical protein
VARDFDDLDALQAQRAGQAGAEAAGAFDTGLADGSAASRPGNQRPDPAPGRRERVRSDQAAERIDEHGRVRVAVRVDSEDDLALEA